MRLPHPILLVCFGVAFGCSVDAVMKHIMLGGTGVLTATSWRYILGSVIMLALFASTRRPIPALPAIRFHALRSLAQVISAFSFFYSLTQIALAEAVVMGFTAALMIAPIARVVLGEKMSPVTIGASLVGFAGAALAATAHTEGGPPDGNRLYGTAAILVSAVLYALNIVLLRLRTKEEDSLTLVTFMNVFPALFLLPFMLLFADWTPETDAWPMMGLVAFLGIGIWWLMTLAYGRAKAQVLAPFEYTGLIWSALLGYVFFQEVPGWRVYAGAAIIIAACLVVAFETHFVSRREAKIPASDILT
ncbi:MAG: DMT family transporter [Hyphomonas sp.]|uniref:DMT family transporter n=1 Tax=Hyphomonas sp. TaxID=87 RepID=UPI0018474E63|nr:DMT family transporter [Hyphomonas sp.]MBA3069294.1 DMT family transporter [Hyphomonas sp.]MBU3921941.1 DMT family transporter [Alphaproteobacteria bacterium]MBU4063675.1 DMT family transporter [Alphaproteobacteria bacterium]MBU4164364.1 DMT family transporter [Alphaproteobacteria bacterium]